MKAEVNERQLIGNALDVDLPDAEGSRSGGELVPSGRDRSISDMGLAGTGRRASRAQPGGCGNDRAHPGGPFLDGHEASGTRRPGNPGAASKCTRPKMSVCGRPHHHSGGCSVVWAGKGGFRAEASGGRIPKGVRIPPPCGFPALLRRESPP
jgi:hypothetical protein